MSLFPAKREAAAETGFTRSGVNTIIPGKVLQRGQIYTWTRDVKQRYLQEWGVTAVINFWPKTDADLGELKLDWYWQMSCPRSEETLEPHVVSAAQAVASYLALDDRHQVLVLCEAGKTRSVFFCVLLVKAMSGKPYKEALDFVMKAVPKCSLKGFMLDWIKKQK